MKYWKKLSHKEQDRRITEALQRNINYNDNIPIGVPVSKLDPTVFNEHVSFLKEAPLLRAFIQNPNHIGCHTMGESEPFFEGTQELEKEVIELLSVDLLKAKENSCDGYIATGGTEANIQAAWIYRNYFIQNFDAGVEEIALLSSADTHYSVSKAANLLHIRSIGVPVNDDTRIIEPELLDRAIEDAMNDGVKYFIVFSNMATTMFGSVDDPDLFAQHLSKHGAAYKIHVDGAYGGFIYPVSCTNSTVNFQNPNVSSITLDAHKMLQAPYGTGVFLARKGLIEYVCTREAKYVSGMDSTLCGSRSGTNAIAVWMILYTYGAHGWYEKISKLLLRTKWLCDRLDAMNVGYYRHPDLNIVTIRAEYVPNAIAVKYGMVPDTHTNKPEWYKIVIMDHVDIEYLQEFIADMKVHHKTEVYAQ